MLAIARANARKDRVEHECRAALVGMPGVRGRAPANSHRNANGLALSRRQRSRLGQAAAADQRRVLVTAIIGLYKFAGVDLVHQQIKCDFSPAAPSYDVSADGLIVWPDEQWEVQVVYDLHQQQWIAPQAVRGLSRRRLPTIERQRLVFSAATVSWQRWVEVWNRDVTGEGHPRDGILPVCVLPS